MSNAKPSQLKGRQSTALAPGPANNENKIILPANTTASLAEITNEIASIAYDTDQETIVINDGSGFQPVSGGGGTPGGVDGNIQFNDAGTFGGSNSLNWDSTNGSLAINGEPGSLVETLRLQGDYQQIGLYHNYQVDPNARAWALYTNNPNSGEIALLISEDEVSDPSVRVWSLDNSHEMFMWQNDKWFYQRNSADNGFVGMIKVDASDRIVLNDSPTNITIDGATGVNTIAAAVSIQLQDGSQGNTGDVWTSTDADGGGNWAPPSAPTGTANTSAYYNASGDLTSNSTAIFLASTNSRADYADAGGTVTLSGEGGYFHGFLGNTGSATVSGRGGLVQGEVGNSGSSMTASGFGSITAGGTFGGSQINAGDGSWAHGYAENASVISAGNQGSEAHGRAQSSSQILGQGAGTKAFGHSQGGFTISATGSGNLAAGYTNSGNITAAGIASVAYGDNNDQQSDYGWSIGVGQANSSYASLVLGRYGSNVGTTGSWVATEPLLVAGNGTGTGSRANALQLDKDGRLTTTAAKLDTSVRLVAAATTLSARTDHVIIADTNGVSGVLTLPPGEDGLMFTFGTAGNAGATYTLAPDGADTLDISIGNITYGTATQKIIFKSGTWYAIA